MTAEQELREAARLIRKHGWTRREYQSHTGELCISGACGVARGRPADHGPSPKAENALRAATNSRYVVAFNDRHCRTANDAIAALKIAADLAA